LKYQLEVIIFFRLLYWLSCFIFPYNVYSILNPGIQDKIKIVVLGPGTLYGWLGFICDNGLKEGDICIFEPSKGTRRATLIFHPLEETHRPKSSGLYVEHLK
jgi:hypothetical protein